MNELENYRIDYFTNCWIGPFLSAISNLSRFTLNQRRGLDPARIGSAMEGKNPIEECRMELLSRT